MSTRVKVCGIGNNGNGGEPPQAVRGGMRWQGESYATRVKAEWKEKFVDKGSKSDIMKMGDDSGLLRVKKGEIERSRMPNAQLLRIEKSFKKNNGMILRNSETDRYLEKRHAEAITLNENTILLMQNPTRASVFEELIHATQYRKGINDGSYLSRLQCEILAQEKLIKYAKAYKLTNYEVTQTKAALKAYILELITYNKDGGD